MLKTYMTKQVCPFNLSGQIWSLHNAERPLPLECIVFVARGGYLLMWHIGSIHIFIKLFIWSESVRVKWLYTLTDLIHSPVNIQYLYRLNIKPISHHSVNCIHLQGRNVMLLDAKYLHIFASQIHVILDHLS